MRKILLLILSLVLSVNLFAQPAFTSASYDEKTSVLTLNFSSVVQNDNVVLNGINIIPGGILTPIVLDETCAVMDEENSNQLNIVLYNDGIFSTKDKIYDLYTSSLEGLKVKLNAATVIDLNNTENTESDLIDLTFNENTSPLRLAAAVFESEGNNLKLDFNEPVTTEAIKASNIKVLNAAGDAISISDLKDNIMLNGDSSIWIQLNATSLNLIHSEAFAESNIQMLKGAVRDVVWNPVQDTLFRLDYVAPGFNVNAVSAFYSEDKNRIEIEFDMDIQDTDWNDNSVVSFRKIHLFKGDTVVSILDDPSYIQISGGTTLRMKFELGDQERFETTFQNTNDIKVSIEKGAVFSADTYIPSIADTVDLDYEVQEESKRFILDPVNTYYSGEGHFLNVAFMETSNATYNTLAKFTDADDDEFADFRSIRIQFMDKDTSVSLPLGLLVPYDSVDTGIFRIPGNEARTLMLTNMDTATLKVSFEPFTFINKRDHGNAGAEFDLRIIPAVDAPRFESVVYELKEDEIIINFDKPVKSETYDLSGMTFDGKSLGTISATMISEDQKTLRFELANSLIGLSKDPDVNIPAGLFNSIFNVPTVALNSSSDNYDAVVKGIGQNFWINDKHKFTRPTYQKFCLLREDANNIVDVYVDIDEWNNHLDQTGLDAFLNMFISSTPHALMNDLRNGIYSAVQTLYGNVSFNDGGKLIALLTDVHDNYETGGNDSNVNLFVPGFYESRHGLSADEYIYSNESDMIFIDTWPQYWDFADTTGLNEAIENGTHSSEQAMADIFTRAVLGKINPDESAWALDGFGGISQILVTGEYSQFYLNNLGIKAVNSGITPLSGNYNFSTRDNQIASTTFLLYLFENIYPTDKNRFLTEYFADNSISSFEKVLSLTNGNITEWFNAYALAQAIEGDNEYTFTVGDDELTAKTGFEYLEYDGLPVLNLPRFFTGPRDTIGAKSIAPYTINIYNIPSDPGVAGQKDLLINASKLDTSFTVFTMGQQLEQTGVLNDDFYDIQRLTFDEEKNAVLNYDIYDNGTFDTTGTYNYHIISACASTLNEMIISTDDQSPQKAEIYLFPNVVNEKYVTIGLISDEVLYNDTQLLPAVYLESDANTQMIEITQKESNIGVIQYRGNWQFVDDGNYSIIVEANDRSGNVVNIPPSNIIISKIAGTVPVVMETENSEISYSAAAAEPESTGYVVLEEMAKDHAFYHLSGVADGIGHAVRISVGGDVDLQKEVISFEIRNDHSGIFRFTGDQWLEIPSVKKGNVLTANIDGEGIYQLRESNGEMVEIVPDRFTLYQNYPNPFNPVTTIKYDVAKQTHVKVLVFNVMGQKVKTLVNKVQEPSGYQIQWNGTSENGKKVASGVYFVTFSAGEVIQTHKMILLK